MVTTGWGQAVKRLFSHGLGHLWSSVPAARLASYIFVLCSAGICIWDLWFNEAGFTCFSPSLLWGVNYRNVPNLFMPLISSSFGRTLQMTYFGQWDSGRSLWCKQRLEKHWSMEAYLLQLLKPCNPGESAGGWPTTWREAPVIPKIPPETIVSQPAPAGPLVDCTCIDKFSQEEPNLAQTRRNSQLSPAQIAVMQNCEIIESWFLKSPYLEVVLLHSKSQSIDLLTKSSTNPGKSKRDAGKYLAVASRSTSSHGKTG